MIRTIRWMAWHLHRRALLGFGIAGFVISFSYGPVFLQAAGTTAAAQAAFGRAVLLVAKQTAFLVPIPVHPETLGGYEQYKLLAFGILLLMLWAGIVAVGIARGEEVRGVTDEWLAAGLSRSRLVVARSAAFLVVLAIVSVVTVLGISAVAPLVQQDPNIGGELLKALSMTCGVFAGFTLALLVAQLPAERQTATALSVGLLVLLLVVNGIADTADRLAWVGVVTPFHWMERTSTAAPGGTFDLFGTLGLAIAALAFLAMTTVVFRRRDIGSGLVSWGSRSRAALRTASHNVMLRMPSTEGLWEQRVGLLVWACSTLVLAAVMVSLTKSMADALFSDPNLKSMFQGAFGNGYEALLGFVWFGFALLILAGYAVVQVSRWTAQDQEGRVEMLLSAPVSRTRVVIERAIEFAAASLLIVVGGYLGLAAEIPSAGLQVDASRVFTASALLWPFALAFGGLGVALASRWPRIAVPVLGAFAVLEYLLGDLAPLFKAPEWVANLSLFHLYGNPITGSAPWTAAITMAVLFVLGFGLAVVLMQRRDVSST
jgi:ABC-2 type transport system permease protein